MENKGMEQLEKDMMNKKHIPKEEEDKIHKKMFENILIVDILMAFLYLVSLGALNIETSVFIKDLQVFSISFIIFTIILFEISYKKENGKLAINGVESFAFSVCILSSIYVYTMHMKDFDLYISLVAYTFSIYYIIKAIIISKKMKKQYVQSLSDIEEIIKK